MIQGDLKAELPYWLLTLLVLAIFYGIYFTKMFMQKRRGIRTNQIGQRKEKILHRVEMLMSVATYSVVAAQLVSVLFCINYMPSGVRFAGFLTAMAGDGIFLAAVLGMRDSWRAGIPKAEKTELVTSGLYAFSRNPAFLGFNLMYAGVFFMYGNVLTGVCTVFAVLMLHLQILQEEKYLTAAFGESYLQYRARVFRYLGRKRQPKQKV